MAQDFCLMPDAIEDFKKALKDKELDMAAFFDPKTTTAEREEMIRPYAGDNAAGVVQKLEQTRVLKNRQLGLQNAISKLGEMGRWSPEKQAAIKAAAADFKARQAERIFSPKEQETFLNSLANKMAGTEISPKVAQKVYELQAEANRLKGEGTSRMSGFSPEYWQAKNALNAYVRTQKNKSAAEAIVANLAVTGRNMKLMNPSTPVKVLENMTVNHTMEMLGRRIATQALSGEVGDLARQAKAEARQTSIKTGVNEPALENAADVGLNMLGERLSLNDVPGGHFPGVVGAVANATSVAAHVTQKIAIQYEHNIGFMKFYQSTFFDSANIYATKIAKELGLDPKDVFRDAVRVEPETQAGAAVRSIAQQEAARVTSTNKTWLSNLSMGIKQTLNGLAPKLRIGDFVVPMAKIPATVIANGIDNAGAGLPFGIRDIVQGKMKLASTDIATKLQGMAQLANGYRRLTRITGTIGLAALLTSGLTKKDFRQNQYGHSFVDIGGVWVDTEYVAMFSPAVAGMMRAVQTGGPVGYLTGAASAVSAAPGVEEIPKIIQAVTSSNVEKGAMKWGKQFLSGMVTVPMIKNLFSDRPLERLFFGAHGVETEAEVRQDEEQAKQKAALTRQGVTAP